MLMPELEALWRGWLFAESYALLCFDYANVVMFREADIADAASLKSRQAAEVSQRIYAQIEALPGGKEFIAVKTAEWPEVIVSNMDKGE
jgi:hypothetical protein